DFKFLFFKGQHYIGKLDRLYDCCMQIRRMQPTHVSLWLCKGGQRSKPNGKELMISKYCDILPLANLIHKMNYNTISLALWKSTLIEVWKKCKKQAKRQVPPSLLAASQKGGRLL